MARKKSTKKTSPVIQEYNRERNRIKRQQNRMLARGYILPADILPPVPKKITAASVRRLKKITTKKLYDQSDFMDLTTGEVVSGQEGRKIERKRSAERAAETRRRKKHDEFMVEEGRRQWEREHPEPEEEESDEQWEEEQRRRDAENRRRMEEQAEYRRQFEAGEMIAQRIEDLIDSIEESFSRDMSKYARNAWEHAIATEGREAVYRRLAEHPEVVDALEGSYYQNRSGDHFNPTSFNRFVQILQGSSMSAEQMQNVQSMYERGQALYPEIDEGITD